jgi:polysaccharide pyruvyl transferase WcaK-like protein
MTPLNQPAPVEEFEEEEPALDIDPDQPEVTVKIVFQELEELWELRERGLSKGTQTEVWGNKDDNDAA